MDGALVHFITVYIPPNNQEFADWIIANLHWILSRIFYMDKKSLVIVAGDFNVVSMKKIISLRKPSTLRLHWINLSQRTGNEVI